MHSGQINLLHVSKNVDLSVYFFRCGNKKKSSQPSQLYAGSTSTFRMVESAVVRGDTGDLWEHALSWSIVIRSRRLVFPISWKTTGKQMVFTTHNWLFCFVLAVATISACTVFPKKQASICLKVLVHFCWIWHILKHSYSRLLFTFGLVCVKLRFVSFHNVIEVFRSTTIVNFEHFFLPIHTNTKFFWHSNFYRILYVCWSHWCLMLSNLRKTLGLCE